ncbi:hypothetical protein FQA39_LY18512 [Lamprigera yunnana]|nr:hypothetical protein FQA39_LY18512 [Lamprigera yunnana]
MIDQTECNDFIEALQCRCIPSRKTIISIARPDYWTAGKMSTSKIAPVTNQWMQELNIDKKFPATHTAMKKLCREHGQEKSTILILKYGEGGFNYTASDLYWIIPEVEFGSPNQIPVAQSKANVLKPNRW